MNLSRRSINACVAASVSAVIAVTAATAAAAAPQTLGTFGSAAVSDQRSSLVAGVGTIDVFHDGSTTPKTTVLPDPAGSAAAASSGSAVWLRVSSRSDFAVGLVDLNSGLTRPLPGASSLVGVDGPPIFGAMGAQWLTVGFDRGALRLNWRTGKTSRASLPKGRTPQTALDSPTLTPAANDPYVALNKKGDIVYYRGSTKKVISGNCDSCGTPVVVGYRVAWLTRGTGTRGSNYEGVRLVNVKTGRSAHLTTRSFAGATSASLSVAGLRPPQLVATRGRVALSVAAQPTQERWTVSAVAWPI